MIVEKLYLTEAPVDNLIDWDTKDDSEFAKQFIDYLSKLGNGSAIAAKFLAETFSPKFIRYYADCAGKNALSNPDNLFLSFLINPNGQKIITDSNKSPTDQFIRVYNLLRNENSLEVDSSIRADDSSILFYPDFWNNIDSMQTQAKIINLYSSLTESLLTEDSNILHFGTGKPFTPEEEEEAKAKAFGTESKLTKQEVKDAITNRDFSFLNDYSKKDIEGDFETSTRVDSVIRSVKGLNKEDQAKVVSKVTGLDPRDVAGYIK